MLRKFVTLLAVLSIGLLPTTVRAQTKKGKAQEPTIVLRVKSFQALVDSFKTVANAIGKGEEAKQVEGVLGSAIGQAALKGVDTKRPWIVYGKIGANLQNMGAVLMIPIKNKQAFLNVLKGVEFNPEEDPNSKGLYIVDQKLQNLQVGFRFANDYVYVTAENFDFIKANNLMAPNKLKTANMKAALSGVFQTNQIPGDAIGFVLAELENRVNDFKAKEIPGENKLEKKLRFALVDEGFRQAVAFLKGSKQVAFSFDVDAKQKQFVTNLSVEGQPKSQFVKNLVDLAGPGSLFAGFAQKKSMVEGLLTFKVPASIRKVFDEALAKGIKEARQKAKNQKERELINQFIAGLEPTLKSSVVDGAVSAVAEADGTISGVAAIRLVDAKKLEQAIKELHKYIPDAEAKKFKLDFAKVDNANIHQVNAQEDYDAQARKMLGKTPVYVAFRNDAAMIGFGKNGLARLKEAITTKKKGGTPSLRVRLAMRNLVPIVSKKEREIVTAKTAFGSTTPGNIVLTATQEGLSATFQMRVDLSVLRFAILSDQKGGEFGAE